jgi:beta-glucosidase
MRPRTLLTAAVSALLAVAGSAVAAAPARAALTPEQRTDALLAQMTSAEKITMMHGGAQCAWGACTDAIPRLARWPARPPGTPT